MHATFTTRRGIVPAFHEWFDALVPGFNSLNQQHQHHRRQGAHPRDSALMCLRGHSSILQRPLTQGGTRPSDTRSLK